MVLLLIILALSYCSFLYSRAQERQKEYIRLFGHPGQSKGGKAFQLLESIYLIETTKSDKVLSGRIDFIEGMYDRFVPASKSHKYQGVMTNVYERYKIVYPDKELTESQISLSMSPSIENMRLFYAECVVRCYERYVAQKSEETNTLKTNAAKERRKQDMFEKGYLMKRLFATYQLPDYGHIDRIEQIRQRVRE